MSVKIMIAGCAKEQRDGIEASVKAAFSRRPAEESWSVSLVHVANQWSVDIDGPEPRYKGLGFVASADELTRRLAQALDEAPSAPAPGAMAGNGAPGENAAEKRERHECEGCASAFEVVYHALANDTEELCPVACPACWHVNKVAIAASAGLTGEYRAQAAS